MTDPAPALVFVEHVLWEPDAAWDAAIEQLAVRFARATPLDLEAVRAAGALHAQLAVLDGWAARAGVDLDRELGRWLDEHLSMHVRPAPTVTRAVRALAAVRPVHLASTLPPRAAESIARHAGCWRSVAMLHAPIADAAALGELLASHPGALLVAGAGTPLPDGATRTELLATAG